MRSALGDRTRAEVTPAAELITTAKSVGARVVVVNPREHVAGDLADLTLSGPAGEVLPVLLRDVLGTPWGST